MNLTWKVRARFYLILSKLKAKKKQKMVVILGRSLQPHSFVSSKCKRYRKNK